jgi:hypothetical protein
MPAHEDDWEDEPATVPCPYCRELIPEDAPRCPYCETYITDEDQAAPPTAKPWWLILGVIACLYAVYRWIVP